MMKTRLALLTAALAALLLAVPTGAGASHAWGGYHWEREANPVQLTIGDNMSSDWDPLLDTAIADWDASAVLSLTEVAGEGGRRCKARSGKIEVCNGNYGYNGWLGLASISISGDHITAGTAKMNDSYFSLSTYDTPEWRQMVVCQEIGHLFGLGHQDEGFELPNLGTCMDYTSDPTVAPANLHPNAHDYAQLEDIYGSHLDTPAPDGGDGGDGGGCKGRGCKGKRGVAGSDLVDAPSDWGTLVSQHGRHAVYERDFGRGGKTITMVTWAD